MTHILPCMRGCGRTVERKINRPAQCFECKRRQRCINSKLWEEKRKKAL